VRTFGSDALDLEVRGVVGDHAATRARSLSILMTIHR
jgi:hypothetical protein